jgi:hypothetical protein
MRKCENALIAFTVVIEFIALARYIVNATIS